MHHEKLGVISVDGGSLRMGRVEKATAEADVGDPIAYGTFSGLQLYDDDGKGGQVTAQYLLQIARLPTLSTPEVGTP